MVYWMLMELDGVIRDFEQIQNALHAPNVPKFNYFLGTVAGHHAGLWPIHDQPWLPDP